MRLALLLLLALFWALFFTSGFSVRAMGSGLCELPFSPFSKHEFFRGSREFSETFGAHCQLRERDFSHVFPQAPIRPTLTTRKYSSDFNTEQASVKRFDISIPLTPDMFILFSSGDHSGALSANVWFSSLADVDMVKLRVTLRG
jgi:hypothetical protein